MGDGEEDVSWVRSGRARSRVELELEGAVNDGAGAHGGAWMVVWSGAGSRFDSGRFARRRGLRPLARWLNDGGMRRRGHVVTFGRSFVGRIERFHRQRWFGSRKFASPVGSNRAAKRFLGSLDSSPSARVLPPPALTASPRAGGVRPCMAVGVPGQRSNRCSAWPD